MSCSSTATRGWGLIGRAAAFLLLAPSACAWASGAATVVVDAAKPLGPVKRLVFGSNVEAADGQGIFSDEPAFGSALDGEGLWNPQTHKPVPAMIALARHMGVTSFRYPGGCLAHGFDWKKAVGPVDSRPHFAFGLDEYLSVCRLLGSEPLITVSDYTGTPQDAADLIEYLNAPADDAHPWARKRAAWGHPKPYGVRWFEMGNESDHGNHNLKPARRFTPEEYVAWVRTCAKLMRAVDPSIQIGALLGTTFPNVEDAWNAKVLAGVKSDVDYIVVHTYGVGLGGKIDSKRHPTDLLMRACMASGEQFETALARYRALIRKVAGRDIPVAVTEYNASFVQEEPIPYRYTLGAALFSADLVRAYLQPESNVFMANYWHLSNGYWGAIQGSGPYKKMPAYWLTRLWAQHFGTKLLATRVDCPRLGFAARGNAGIAQDAFGTLSQEEALVGPSNLLDRLPLAPAQGDGYKLEVLPGHAFRATFENLSGDRHIPLADIVASVGTSFDASFEARTTGSLGRATFGIGLIDARGWFETLSGAAVEGAKSAHEWQRFQGRFHTREDCPGATLTCRLLPGSETVSGTFEVRNLVVRAVRRQRVPAYKTVTATASLSADGKKLFVVAFNKHHAEPIDLTLKLNGFAARAARRWTVTGPALESVNLAEELVRETESGVAVKKRADGTFLCRLPAHSMSAFEMVRR